MTITMMIESANEKCYYFFIVITMMMMMIITIIIKRGPTFGDLDFFLTLSVVFSLVVLVDRCVCACVMIMNDSDDQ